MSGAQKKYREKMKGILTDVTKCIGCERCVAACVRQHKLPEDLPARFKSDDGLSAYRYTSIVKISGKTSGSQRMVRRQCMHCLDPSCQAACLVGAFRKRTDGGVEYDYSKCIGCRYCMIACPFTIPRYEYDKPIPYVRKCKMNEDCRVEGGEPACVAACPTGATIFGTRDKLILEAKRRIYENPERYIDHIYGEHDFGGTSVLYISDVPLNDVLNMPGKDELKKRSLSQLSTHSVPSLLHKWVMVTPFQFLSVFTALSGIWFLKRRSKLMKKKEENSSNEKQESEGGKEEGQ